MTEQELQQYLLRKYPQENAHCDWKEMKNLKNSFCGDEKDDVISYVSAIANMEGGELVIGVQDKTLNIIGTDAYNYNVQNAVLRLKERCTNLSSEDLCIDEFITEDTRKKVWVIHIPKHLPKLPVYAHNKAWQRIEDSLVEMTQERLNAILAETIQLEDWSAGLVQDATIDDLDEEALVKARFEFKKVYPKLAKDVDTWSNIELLNHAGIAVHGHLTRAAFVLLGKEESGVLLRPAVAQVTWILEDENGCKVDYEHFYTPFLLNVDKILGKIRNLTFREMPGGTLFPDLVKQYDDYSIREILHNCLAHQDYLLQQRITLIEQPGSLLYSNGGYFLPGTIMNAIEQGGPQKYYRNQCLCRGMVAFNMIDTIGRGIEKVFTEQQRRFFPMPDYIINQAKKEISVRIYGKVINNNYVQLLKNNENLSLYDCMYLDAVQKGKTIDKDMADSLRKRHLIEGRYPNVFLSESVSRNTGQLGEYVRKRGLTRKYYKDMIISFLEKKKKGANRSEIDELLVDMIPKSTSNPKSYIGNLLYELKNKDKKVIYLDEVWKKIDGK
jgi:ATP-dependent DNA helicase RecG